MLLGKSTDSPQCVKAILIAGRFDSLTKLSSWQHQQAAQMASVGGSPYSAGKNPGPQHPAPKALPAHASQATKPTPFAGCGWMLEHPVARQHQPCLPPKTLTHVNLPCEPALAKPRLMKCSEARGTCLLTSKGCLHRRRTKCPLCKLKTFRIEAWISYRSVRSQLHACCLAVIIAMGPEQISVAGAS